MADAEIKFQVDLPVGDEWQNVELLRTSLLNCLTVVFQNSDFCHAVSMVAGELLENAVKYGEWSAGAPSLFRIRVVGAGSQVGIEVSNPVPARSEHVTRLLETIEWLKGMASPAEAYAAKLREVAAAETPAGVSHLGLVRIAYEGNCTLDASLKPDHVLTVRATCSAS